MTRKKQSGLRKPLTPIVFNVLLSLHDGPLHGYGIMGKVEEQTDGKISKGPGAIYGTIERLRDAGLVVESPASRHDATKRTYELTELGRSELVDEARRIQGMAALVESMRVIGGSRS